MRTRTPEELADLPDHELRRALLEHLAGRDPVPIRIRDLRRMVLDDEGLDLVRQALVRRGPAPAA